MGEYGEWMEQAGFRDLRTRDVTRNVESTWDRCAEIARRPEVRLLLRAADESTRRFVAAFELIGRAYREDAMRYGMLAGTMA
jgi:hypothetical protein